MSNKNKQDDFDDMPDLDDFSEVLDNISTSKKGLDSQFN